MDCITGWSPFSAATVTISNDYADKILYAQDLYVHIHNHRSLLEIEIVSFMRPVTIKGSWLALTKLEMHLKNLFNDATQNDSEEPSTRDSDLNFDLVFANFKESMKMKERRRVSRDEQCQICTFDHLNQTLQTETKVLNSCNYIGIHKGDKVEEWLDRTVECTVGSIQIPESKANNQLTCCRHGHCSKLENYSHDQSLNTDVMSMQPYRQKHCHKNVSDEKSVPNPVVIGQPSDFSHDELLNFNTYFKEKTKFKDVQKIFNAIFTPDTIQKFKMGASRDEECNVIFKSGNEADDFQGSKMNGNTKKSAKNHANGYTEENSSINLKEKRGTCITTEISRVRKKGSRLKGRKTKEARNSSIDVPTNNCEQFHYLKEISGEVEETEIMLNNDSSESIVDESHLQSDNEDETLKQAKNQKDECLSCDLCNFVTSKKPYLKMHKKRVHSSKHFKCPYCSKTFAIEKDLRKHLKCHNEAQNCCDVCGKMYKNKRTLQAHKITHDEDYVKPEFPCKFCKKSFTDKYVLAYHIKRDHLNMKKSFACPTCGKTFTQKGSYLQHANVHLGVKPFVCEICKKSFAYGKSLKEHKAMHNEKKLFKCHVCSKSFQQSSGLRAHEKTHSLSKDYVCSLCGRGFSQKHALVRHERIHFGEKPFGCNLCSRLFSDESVLRRHMISVHKKDASCWRTDTVTHS